MLGLQLITVREIMFFSLVSFLYFILVCGILFVLLLPNFMGRCLRFVTLLTVNVVFFLSILLWVQFAVDSYGFQHIVAYAGFKELNIHLILGIDGISLFFVLITTLIFPFAVLSV